MSSFFMSSFFISSFLVSSFFAFLVAFLGAFAFSSFLSAGLSAGLIGLGKGERRHREGESNGKHQREHFLHIWNLLLNVPNHTQNSRRLRWDGYGSSGIVDLWAKVFQAQ
jgi:hypothetical protein